MSVPDTPENAKNCICGDCPTFKAFIKTEGGGLFCATGKAVPVKDAIEEDECLCTRCAIDQEYKLTARLDLMEKKILKMNQFYCSRGPAGSGR
jgi:hypothetical protein